MNGDYGNFTQIVFGCIGSSKDPFSCDQINAEFGFISNYFETKYYEELVINKIKLKVNKR